MSATAGSDQLVQAGAAAIRDAFGRYDGEFNAITQRARARFERREWRETQADAVARIDLYKASVDRIVADIHAILGPEVRARAVWRAMHQAHAALIEGRADFELAATFFNSVTRRIFATVGVDAEIEYVSPDFPPLTEEEEAAVYRTFIRRGTTRDLIREILEAYRFDVSYEDAARDAALVAQAIDAFLYESYGIAQFDVAQIVKSVFYRSKAAYLVGCLRVGSASIPLVVPLINPDGRISVDTVLLTDDEVSIVFSFTRSYFRVETNRPRALVAFLKSIMPLKRIAELYTAIGYNKHGKTEFYRDLLRHVEASDEDFVIAAGARGMVMTVFTLPSYDVVFKVIKDTFAYPKTNTRQDVMKSYQLVFRHDRAGRLIDAQEFEHMTFARRRFSAELLAELLAVAGSSVMVTADEVAIRHLYVERRLTPLDLYLHDAGEGAAVAAILDYGRAIKDLAATNIFPGDFLLKNFGVTRHGRVVFYDYDELCLLTGCHFRAIPRAPSPDEEFAPEPWFYVGEHDVFPEEFLRFLGLHGRLRDVFLERHADLMTVAFWQAMQARHAQGEIVDIFPYPRRKRFHRHRPERVATP